MPRPRPPLNPESFYHITSRCIHRKNYPLPLSKVWEIYENHLFFLHYGFDLQIFSFLLMSNHFHAIVRAPQGNLSQAMRYFLRESSLDFNRITGRINQNYGQRYRPTEINSYLHFLHAFKYVYRNPVKAGLCEKVEDYPYSTLRLLLGLKKIVFPLQDDKVLFENNGPSSALHWLNQPPSEENYEIIKKALRKNVFSIPLDRTSRKVHSLESMLF